MIRALVFDFDGLIIDTETPIIEAWVRVHVQAGVAYRREHALAIVGHSDIEHDPWIAFGPHADRLKLEEQHRLARHELLLSQPILPGVAALITDARRRGIKLGIASNSPHSWVDNHLARVGLAQYFDIVRCRDDVARGKPEPELYQSAIAAVGMQPHEAIAFEDSPPGSEAANRAGIFCVVAPNPSTQHHVFPHADLRVGSLADVSVDFLSAQLETRNAGKK